MINIAQLESDLRAAKTKARDLIDATARTCADHIVTPSTATTAEVRGRVMTAAERAAIDALLADAEAIQQRIDGAQSDANLLQRLDQIATRPSATGIVAPTVSDRRSIGQQFAQHADFLQFIRQGG